MKRYMAGVICMAMVIFMAGSVFAEEGTGEQAQEREHKEKHERKKDGRGGRHRGNPAEMLKKMDKDQDGKVTLEEFTESHLERIKEMFDRMDANKDGVISQEDHDAREQERKKSRERRKSKEKKGEGAQEQGQED